MDIIKDSAQHKAEQHKAELWFYLDGFKYGIINIPEGFFKWNDSEKMELLLDIVAKSLKLRSENCAWWKRHPMFRRKSREDIKIISCKLLN